MGWGVFVVVVDFRRSTASTFPHLSLRLPIIETSEVELSPLASAVETISDRADALVCRRVLCVVHKSSFVIVRPSSTASGTGNRAARSQIAATDSAGQRLAAGRSIRLIRFDADVLTHSVAVAGERRTARNRAHLSRQERAADGRGGARRRQSVAGRRRRAQSSSSSSPPCCCALTRAAAFASQSTLRAQFQRFIAAAGDAVALNAQLIGDDQLEFQRELESGYATTRAELAKLTGNE